MCGIFLRLVSQLRFLLREITEMKDTGDFRTFSACWQYYCGKNKNQWLAPRYMCFTTKGCRAEYPEFDS